MWNLIYLSDNRTAIAVKGDNLYRSADPQWVDCRGYAKDVFSVRDYILQHDADGERNSRLGRRMHIPVSSILYIEEII